MCIITSFRLEIDAQNEWLLIKSPPNLKRKRSIEQEIPPPPPPPPAPAPTSKDLDDILRTIAEPTSSTTNFTFQFGNKRGRPIPPRPQVISAVKVSGFQTISFFIHMLFLPSGQFFSSTTSSSK